MDELLRALRLGPKHPSTWLHRLHLWRCPVCQKHVAEEEQELVRRFTTLMSRASVPSPDVLTDEIPDQARSRQRLLQGMRDASRSRGDSSTGTPRFPSRPALIFAGLLAASATIVFLIPAPKHPPTQTVDDLMTSAVEAQERVGPEAPAGVIFQQVEVRERGQRVEWPVYRDRQGRRKSRFTIVSNRDVELRQRLALAEVSRDNPLSAAAFNHWRSKLRSHAESVTFSPSGLITVTASALASDTSAIASESLTLRSIDYHPVARGVQFRDRETIEVAELEFKVLPWSQVRREWFEESATQLPSPALRAALAPVAAVPALTSEELYLAELQARTVLTRDDADVNEQIELTQTASTVLVHGLASTTERKQQLQKALLVIPHVSVEIQTPSEREASQNLAAPPQTGAIKMIGSVSQPSPLLLYWTSQHRNPQDLAQLSSRLMDSALRVRQQSHAMRALGDEASQRKGVQSHEAQVEQAYQALWREHATKLQIALDDEAAVLKTIAPQIQSIPSVQKSGSSAFAERPTIATVDGMASDSLAICRKLSAGDNAGSAEALPLLQEMWRDWAHISAAMDAIPKETTDTP